MSNQVENPILTSCPPKPPSPVIDLTSATRSNKISKLISLIWNYFEKKTINGVQRAIYNHYNSKLKATSLYDTTHLHNQLQRCAKRNNGDIRYLFDQNKILVDKISERVRVFQI
jgi:hypothetical protein